MGICRGQINVGKRASRSMKGAHAAAAGYMIAALRGKDVVGALAVGTGSPALKRGGTPVDIRGKTIDVVQRMGIYGAIREKKLPMHPPQIRGDRPTLERHVKETALSDDIEIERDSLLDIMFDAIKNDVRFVFDNSIDSLGQTDKAVTIQFKKGPARSFDLVFGCDGVHSDLRKKCFGPEQTYAHFLQAYGSVTIVDSLLIQQNTVEIFCEPGKMAVLSAYNGKTDIILMFASHTR